MAQLIRLADYRRGRNARRVYFTRAELSALMSLYSEHVARGHWRDYAIDHRPGMAVFSVYRHTAEQPLYAIAKFGAIGSRAESYALFEGPHRRRQASELEEILAPLRRRGTGAIRG